jgi:serine/threonine protein kinase
MIGQTVSHYKIIEKLGEGGMGIVYRAHDTKLDRDVALKFLPHDLTVSDEERSRFTHEAKAVSALDHPNICTVYEVDETPDGRMFMAMGYYEGASLSQKIAKGKLDVTEAVWIAIQIAEGLQAAHEKGIVHRDIKSGNIIVTDKEQVKILDFGLARKRGLSKLTKTGTTVGTASYMSPEQARGEAVDLRTDLWSLGVVLYEMVTGHVPFRGEHEAAILYSVVNEEPQPIQMVVPDASPELVHIIRRALEKDPGERYQSATDMLIDLRRLKKDTSRTGFPPVRVKNKMWSSRRSKIILFSCIAGLIFVTGYLYFIKNWIVINPNFTQRIIQISLKKISAPAISPDGKWIVIGAINTEKKWDLYVVSVNGGEPRRLTFENDTVGTDSPNISSDGNNIVYNRGSNSEICTVPFIGGTSKKIGVGANPQWSPDGRRIGYMLFSSGNVPQSTSTFGEFWTMNPDGAENHLEFVDTLGTRNIPVFSFAFSPDCRSVAWLRKLPARFCEIVIHDLSSNNERRLVSDTTWKGEVCWAPNDQILYSARGVDGINLWMVPAHGGVPTQITKVTNRIDISSISSDGKRIAYAEFVTTSHVLIASLDGSNKKIEVASEEADVWYPEISPDGKLVTFSMQPDNSPELHLYVLNRDGSNRRRMTSGQTVNFGGRWSPDSRYIAYNSKRQYESFDSEKVYVMSTDRFDVPRLIHSGRLNSWRDATTLEIKQQNKYWAVSLDGRSVKQFSEDSIYALSLFNGKYVLFHDDHSHTDSLWRVCRSEDWNGSGSARPWIIWKGPTHGISKYYGIMYLKNENELWRISFNDGKKEKYPATFPGIDLSYYRVRVSSDGKEMIYKTTDYITKIGVIENLFK